MINSLTKYNCIIIFSLNSLIEIVYILFDYTYQYVLPLKSLQYTVAFCFFCKLAIFVTILEYFEEIEKQDRISHLSNDIPIFQPISNLDILY